MIEAHVLAITVLGVSSFLVGCIPLKLTSWKTPPFLLSVLLCWGGGVLLATAMVHMLAEVHSKLPDFAELLFCAGFLLLYAVDELLHLCVQDVHTEHDKNPRKSNSSKGRRTSSSSSSNEGVQFSVCQHHSRAKDYGTIEKLPKRVRYFSLSHEMHDHLGYPLIKGRATSTRSLQIYHGECSKKHEKEHAELPKPSKAPANTSPDIDSVSDSSQSSSSSYLKLNIIDQCHTEVNKPCSKKSTSSILGLFTALLIHSLLEGCSIGVQSNSWEILLVTAAVASHKLVLAFCLGLELASAGYTSFSFFLPIAAFSIGCPIGIVIGVYIAHSSDGIFVLEAPLQAIAAGSLLYVAVFEVLPRERYKWQHKSGNKYSNFLQMVAVVIGFTCIALIGVFLDNHGHGSGSLTP